VVNAAICNLSGESESSISGNKEVVPRIVLQFECVAGGLHQTDHRSTDFESRLCADDLHVGDIRGCSASSVHYGARLHWVRRLRLDRDCIGSARGNRSRERKRDVSLAGDREVVAAVILKYQPTSNKAGN